MKHMASGTIAFIGVLALAGCYSYTGEAINNSNYNTVQATPNFVKVKVGDSTEVIARLVNDNNNGAITSYTVGGGGAGILVHNNANYRPVFDSKLDTLVQSGDKTAQQYFVVGSAVGRYTFTLTPTAVNTGISGTVTVVVTPLNLGAALSRTTAATGDTIILTAPAGTKFSQASAVSFATGSSAIVARAADSSTITLVVGMGVTGPATVTKVGVTAVPNADLATLVTTNSLTTPVATLGALSESVGNIGDVLTINAPLGTVFSQTSALSFTTGTAAVLSRAADSTSIRFSVGAGVSGPLTVTKVGVRNGPTVPVVSLTSSNSLTTTAAVPTTVSTTTPAIGTVTTPFTVTLGGGLRFIPTSTVRIGTTPTIIISTSADSSSVVVIPFGGVTGGVVTFANIVPGANNTIIVGGPGDKSVTLALVTDPLSNALATAPTITPAASGSFIVISGTGPFTNPSQCAGVSGDGCQLFKVVLATPGVFDIALVWQGGSDNAIYRLNSAGGGATSGGTTGDCDAGGQGASGQPERCTMTLAAGTYYFTFQFFGTGSGYPASANTVPPAWYQFKVTTR